jgi:hypothetical protein
MTESQIMQARWRNVVRLARALGVEVPKWRNSRRRYVVVRRIVEALGRAGSVS